MLSGLAGSVVICRGGGDGVTVLPGVAIAVAVMPPLCAMGFGLGGGLNLEIMGGAGLLFVTNLVAIVASAFLVFLMVGMSTPEVRQALVASWRHESLARILPHGRIAQTLAAGGKLRWRILMLLILLASVAVPLRRALLQVASETLTRGTVQDEMKRLVASDAIVSQQVTFGQNEIAIHLISTRRIPDSKVAELRQDLMRRTGRNVRLTVDAVASKSELADLMERLARPAPEIPKERAVGEMQKQLLDRVRPAIQEIWPSSDAPMQDFAVVLGTAGIEVDVRYQAAKDLGAVPIGMVLQNLRTKLGIPDLTLKTVRIPPARVPVKKAQGKH
jgi:uncharacterized membrane protein